MRKTFQRLHQPLVPHLRELLGERVVLGERHALTEIERAFAVNEHAIDIISHDIWT